jgi:hypothetical protein
VYETPDKRRSMHLLQGGLYVASRIKKSICIKVRPESFYRVTLCSALCSLNSPDIILPLFPSVCLYVFNERLGADDKPQSRTFTAEQNENY